MLAEGQQVVVVVKGFGASAGDFVLNVNACAVVGDAGVPLCPGE